MSPAPAEPPRLPRQALVKELDLPKRSRLARVVKDRKDTFMPSTQVLHGAFTGMLPGR